MDDQKQEYPKFTPTVATIKISSPFINKTERTGNTVRFECTGVTHKSENKPNQILFWYGMKG